MHPLRKSPRCLLYAGLAVFVFCYVVYTYYGEQVIRKFLHQNWDKSIKVDWDSIPFTDEELERHQKGIKAADCEPMAVPL